MNAAKPQPYLIDGIQMTHAYMNKAKASLVEMGESGALTLPEKVSIAWCRRDRLSPDHAARNVSTMRKST